MKISVVIPVFNEEKNVAPLAQEVFDALHPSEFDFETIFIDDGSTDDTVKEIKNIKRQHVVLIELRKNYGQSAALKAGIDQADGDFIATLDGDMQNDPADIINMMQIFKEKDIDLVMGIRQKRQDGMLLRKIPSKIANALVRRVSKTNIIDNGCGIKVFRAEIAKELKMYGEMHRFIAISAVGEGAKIEQIPVNHRARLTGESKYGLGRTFKVISDLILMRFANKYGSRPMHLLGSIGIKVSIIGFAIMLYLLILKILGGDIWGRPIIFVGIIFLFGGFQIITTGITMDLLMRTHYESQDKKVYKVRKIEKID